MKKILSLLVVVLIVIGTVSIYAYNYADEITVELNGNKIWFDQPPILRNDRTLVPMRKIFEAMDCEVYWYESSEMIDVWNGNKNIMTLWVDSPYMTTCTGTVELDVPPIVINNRTLVPVRAISESIGAMVDWDDYSQTVIITYDASNNSYSDNSYNDDDISGNSSDYRYHSDTSNGCSHKNTRKIASADSIRYRDIGLPDAHDYYVRVHTVCTDCGETIDYDIEEKMLSHDFKDGVCIACGYKEKGASSSDDSDYTDSTSDADDSIYNSDDIDDSRDNSDIKPTRPSSSGSLSDYINGAFMYITVPAGKSIEIPNSSNGTLKIQMEGIYNVMERRVDGTVKEDGYNTKNKKGSFSITKNAKCFVQNSGGSDLVVSIPSEFASYSETYEAVYETYQMTQGESISIKPNNNQGAYVYHNNKNFEWMKFNNKTSLLTGASQSAGTGSYNQIYKDETMLITSKSELEIYYCPAKLTLISSDLTAFAETTVGTGQTVRIYAPENSNTRIYIESGYVYDYVTYGSGGKVASQQQNKKAGSSYQTLNKGNYMDITNTSTSPFTIKIPNGYGYVQ